MMRKVILSTLLAMLMVACTKESNVKVSGSITGADGNVVYLEWNALDGVHVLDSARLDAAGDYELKFDKELDNPEFYALRIGTERIYFSIDSVPVTVRINTSLPDLLANSVVEGSENAAEIKEIAIATRSLEQSMQKIWADKSLLPGEVWDSIESVVKAYKQRMRDEYILPHATQPCAYFAVCQSVNDGQQTFQIFNPVSNRDDVKLYAAIATAWDGQWPDADRTIQLCNMAVKGMDNTAPDRTRLIEVDDEKISEAGIIDIALPDIAGNVRRLSELRGRVVLLDFTMYGAKESAVRTRLMRELYNKYEGRGLEIYQVSLDDDIHFWKFSCENLPWICVHETDGRATTSYAVTSLPTFFLINSDNEVVVRSDNIQNLDEELQRLL